MLCVGYVNLTALVPNRLLPFCMYDCMYYMLYSCDAPRVHAVIDLRAGLLGAPTQASGAGAQPCPEAMASHTSAWLGSAHTQLISIAA